MQIESADFKRLSAYIYDHLGIRLTESKQTMLLGRLSKRMRALHITSVNDYCDYIFSCEGEQLEQVHLFDAITTNKTDFYRESSHFDYLTNEIIPIWQKTQELRRPLRIWSAGCSSGEEPYTMAMVLSAFAEKNSISHFDYEIIATDISTRVLDQAKKAIYHSDRVKPVPADIRKKYLLRNKDQTNPLVRIVPQLRSKVRFGRLNFMDPTFALPYKMDVIFCRNVIIYFDKQTQEQLMVKFCQHLQPNGNLFLGHSESLSGYQVPLRQIAPTVYRHSGR